MIRTGLLAISDLHNATLAAVTSLLGDHVPAAEVVHTQAVGSQRHWIANTLIRWCDEEELDLVLTLGGTCPAPGHSGLEIVPQAMQDILDRTLPGLEAAMRMQAATTTRLAYLDCGTVGIRGRTLLVNLPAGSAAAALFFSSIVDLVPAAIAHLREEPDAPRMEDELEFVAEKPEAAAIAQEDMQATSGLNSAEFFAFQRRRRGESKTSPGSQS